METWKQNIPPSNCRISSRPKNKQIYIMQAGDFIIVPIFPLQNFGVLGDGSNFHFNNET